MSVTTPAESFFTALQVQLEKSITASQALSLIVDIENTAYLSSNFINEITTFEGTDKGTIIMSGSVHSGSGMPGAIPANITLPLITDSFWSNSNSDFMKFDLIGGALSPSVGEVWNKNLTEPYLKVLASEIVGVLAHELGHVADATAAAEVGPLNPKVGVNQGFYAGILLLSEGKATANAVQVAEDITNNSANKVAYRSYVPLVNLPDTDGIALLTKYQDPTAVTSVSEYATTFSKLFAPTYLSLYLSDWSQVPGSVNDAALVGSNIDFTSGIVTEASDKKSLLTLSFNRTVASTRQIINTIYNYQTMTRSDTDVTNVNSKILLDTEHANADGTSQLTNFANAGVGGYTLAVNASVTSFINGSLTYKTASVTGIQWAINFSVSMSVANFGTISGGSSGGGVSLNAGGSVTNGSTADLTATITGPTAISFGSSNASQVSNFAIITGNTGISTSGSGPLTVTNGSATDTTASIKGTGYRGVAAGGTTTVVNFGSIFGSDAGLGLTGGSGSSVTNGTDGTNGSPADTGASISGGLGILAAGSGPSIVNNFGTISGSSSDGIRLSQGGTVNNGSAADTKASITGAGWGVNSYSGTLTNYGTISGGSGGVIINSGTVKNFGKISSSKGASGTAISYQPGGTNRLVEGPGSVIVGAVYGYGTLTVELASGASAGTIGGLGTNINGASTIAVDSGAIWTFSGANSIASFVNNGTAIVASGGSLNVSSAVDPSSSGVFQLATNASLEIAAALGTNVKMQFLGSSPTNKLIIDKAANFGTNVGTASYAGPLLENFAAGDVIDLKGISPASLGLNYTAATGVLKITGSGGSALATLLFQNSTLGAGTFHAASDGSGGSGGTLITRS